MLQHIKDIIKKANSNYQIIYEEKSMMNKKVDELEGESSFAYIEEFKQGKYIIENYINKKTTRIEIYFSKFVDLQDDAIKREVIRTQIEEEVVLSFMKEYNASNVFSSINDWSFYHPLPRWDANEVSVLLVFDCKVTRC